MQSGQLISESRVQSSILGYLNSLSGVWTVKTVATNKRGTPDILACIYGVFVAFEVKRPGGKPTRLQQLQCDAIKKAGGIAVVVDSLDDAKQVVNAISEHTYSVAKCESC